MVKNYEALTNLYTWILLISFGWFFGWLLWATKAPEAGFLFSQIEAMRIIGQACGWVFLATAVIYYLTYRRHNYGK